jgi:signal transduction protein with GAF and PtsI domain
LQIADVRDQPASEILDMIVRAGFRAVLIVPLLGAERIIGALVVSSSSCRFRGWADQAGQ